MDDDRAAVEIPLIVAPGTGEKPREKTPKKRKKSNASSGGATPSDESYRSPLGEERRRSAVGGSLKYDRERERPSVIGYPIKWSSVRIKGTGFEDSTKVKVEPCNGMPMGVDYEKIVSPTTGGATGNMKNNIGNVSVCLLMDHFFPMAIVLNL